MQTTAMQDTLLIGDVDIRSIPGVAVNSIEYWAPGVRRGDSETIPGRQGQIGFEKPLDAYAFSVQVTVFPYRENGSIPNTVEGRRGQMVKNLRTLSALIQGYKAGGQLVLKRRLTLDEDEYEVTTAYGEFVSGTALEQMNFQTGRTELEFVNLDGAWYSEDTIEITPGVRAIEGEFASRRMLISLPGPGTLTNVDANVSLTVAVACELDTLKYSASAGIATLAHEGDAAWFLVVPGSNEITWTGSGTPVIQYYSVHV